MLTGVPKIKPFHELTASPYVVPANPINMLLPSELGGLAESLVMKSFQVVFH